MSKRFSITDDRGRELTFFNPPRRVVSLVPSDTYTFARLGGAERLVGRTRYCEVPELPDVPVVGGTKDPDVDAIVELAPDVVLMNQEENTLAVAERLHARGLRVLVFFPTRATHSIRQVARLARLLGDVPNGAKDVVREAYRADRELRETPATSPPVRVFVPIWMDPLMTIHGDTFISDTLAACGAENVFADRERRYPLAADLGEVEPKAAGARDTRYPRVTLDEVVARAPELVLLPDEPHPFSEADAEVFRTLPTPAAERGAVRFVVGKHLMWPGLMALEGLAHVRAMLRGPS
jgi:ABC-type Fe3+-hydroxamate transport system substrate-binding protein